jgi:hypothetical protein
MSILGHSLRTQSALKQVFVRCTPNSDQTFCSVANAAMCQQRTHAPQQITTLFDHLVGAGEYRRRNGEAEGLGSFEVNDKLELGRRLNRKIGRVLALEDAIDVAGRAPINSRQNRRRLYRAKAL